MSDKPDIFMPLFLGDFLKHVGRLQRDDIGSYLLILMDYWVNGAPHEQDIATIARCPQKAWPEIRRKLAPFFHIDGGVWRQKRVEEELGKAVGRMEKAQKAADARWNGDAPSIPRSRKKKPKADARSIAQASPEHMPQPCYSHTPGITPAVSQQGGNPPRNAPPLPAEGQAALSREEVAELEAAEARGLQGPGVERLRRRRDKYGVMADPPALKVVGGTDT